jgi:hypothetical protein
MTRARTEPGRCRHCAAAALLLLAACAAGPPAAPPAVPPAVPPPAAPGAPPAPAGAAAPPPVPAEVPSRPSLGLFSQIKAPSDVEPVLELAATGVQIFRCEADRHWTFRLPEAELRDAHGQVAVHHGANYSFEDIDGSHLIGTIVGNDPAPDSGAVRWLLLRTQSYGQGELEKVTYVQRVDTSGGMPPDQCSADQVNQVLRVPFSARFIFYRPR